MHSPDHGAATCPCGGSARPPVSTRSRPAPTSVQRMTTHQHTVTLHMPDVLYAALQRLCTAQHRSMESEAIALLQGAVAAPTPCLKPTSECPLEVLAYEGDRPIAALCKACGRRGDIRANPIGN